MHQTQEKAEPPIYLFLLSIPERVLNLESKSTMTQGLCSYSPPSLSTQGLQIERVHNLRRSLIQQLSSQ